MLPTESSGQGNAPMRLVLSSLSFQMEGFEWATLSSTKSSPFLVRVGTRKSVNLFDIRTGTNRLELVRWDDAENLGGFCSSGFSPFQFYCATNRGTMLLDERFTAKSLSRWDHPASREDRDIPVGCRAKFLAENGY